MSGYHGKYLKVDLSTGEISDFEYPEEWKNKYIGGRGFAVKLLWDNIPAGTDPLGPENWLIFAIGPLSGLRLPSSGKMIVAAKSPLTEGYGDGNLGTRASPNLKKAGYDGIIISGKADSPVMIEIIDQEVKIKDASHLWGKGVYDTEKLLREDYGRKAGLLSIGQAGENLVKYATIRSQEGRSGGRPGMGAVMGSKNLKSIIVLGSGNFPMKDSEGLIALGKAGYQEVKKAEMYDHWMNQGTTLILEFLQETSTLPSRNFTEGTFEHSTKVDGDELQRTKIKRAGCPGCNMVCGLIIHDADGNESELDYENIGMLGPNIGIGDMKEVGVLNYMADDYGLDTISLGSVLGMAAEAAENGVLGEKYGFGQYEKSKALITRLSLRSDEVASLLAEGTMRMQKQWGDVAKNWAIQVKGLEASAYNSGTVPGMALSFGTSPIGAHHKDAWVIQYELTQSERYAYGRDKAEKVIELQRIRGGMFESLTTCRFPWIELGHSEENYPNYLKKVTGRDNWTLAEIYETADRIYALMRSFWVREFLADGKNWDRKMDYPPSRWLNEGVKNAGPHTGKHLDVNQYDGLLDHYYELREWDDRGIPTRSLMDKLGLSQEAEELNAVVKLK